MEKKDKKMPFDNMDDNDIRVLGMPIPQDGNGNKADDSNRKNTWRKYIYGLAGAAILLAIIAAIFVTTKVNKNLKDAPAKPTAVLTATKNDKGYTSIADTTVNDIPLRIYTPHNAVPELRMGNVDVDTTPYVLGAMAADVGRDNDEWKVVSGFIYKGKLISHSISRWGYCAIINGKMKIGRELHTPLFEQCIDEGGDFFRHDALVDKGRNVSNAKRGRSVRRALAIIGGNPCIVETETIVSLHDFAEALCNMKATEAIGLMGSGDAVRWAIDQAGRRYATGNTEDKFPPCVNYIVWRSADR